MDGVDHEEEAGRPDDSDSDESDFEEVEASQEDIDLVAKLEAELQSNPNNYDSNVQYIDVLQRCKMKQRLRSARQAMQAIFPMTEALWVAWLTDEAASSLDADVCTLYEKAVEDYLSVNLWTQYLGYLRKHDADVQRHSPAGIKKYKDVSERALTAAGLHMAEGGRIWDAYRGYLQESVCDGAPTPEEAQRVRELFHRQLQVPLLGHEGTLEAHAAWEAGLPEGLRAELPGTVRQGYERAAAAAALRAASEAAVGPGRAADADLLAAYLAYVKLEEVQGDPARVMVLYERMLAAFPVTHHLWLQYGRFLEARLKAPAAARRTYARAVRNCPWVGELWGRALRALEADCAPPEQAAELYTRALAAGLQTPEDYLAVILPRLDGLRRQGPGAIAALRAAFQEATTLMGDYFPQYIDRALHLPAYWAECELRIAQDPTAARAVWETALKRPVGRYADAWAAYIALELGAGHMTEVRALYRRACPRRLEEGGQAALCQAWLRFEREHGDLASLAQAELKTEPVLTAAAAEAAVAANAETATAAQAAAKARKLSKAEMRQLRREHDPNFKKPAASRAPPGQQEAGPPAAAAEAPSSKAPKRKEDAQEPGSTKRQKVGATSDGAMEDTAPSDNGEDQAMQPEAPEEAMEANRRPGAAAGRMGPPPPRPAQPAGSGGKAGSSGHNDGGGDGREAAGRAPSAGGGAGPRLVFTDEGTVFVKGLREAVGEADLEALFGPCGALRGVRIGRDAQTGRHRGFAYVTFGTDEALQQALALSGTNLHGTKITVAISRPPGGGGRGGRGGAPRGGRGRAPGPGRDSQGGGRGPSGGRGQGGGRGARGRGADIVHEAPPGHHRMHLDLNAPEGAARPSAPSPFVPRAVVKAKDASDAAPKSNADFRNMFLKK